MLIFSHRGLGFGEKENSIDSYKKALVQGFSIEIDVQKSCDDKLVICHDTSLIRVRGVDEIIPDIDFEELKRLNIPSFKEVLYCFREYGKVGQKIAVHIKDELQGDIVELVIRTIKEKNLVKECFIFDLSRNGAKHAKQLCSDLQIGLSVGEKKYTGTIYLWDEVKEDINMDIVWWDEWNSGLYSERNALLIKESGRKNYVISPELHAVHNHPNGGGMDTIKKVWEELIEMDVDGICTDYPKELRDMLSVKDIKNDKLI
jgi:glycerophosphoryl diester phosphodiesterase